MTNFEFVVNDGAPGRVTAAIRSHAVRNGLHRKTAAEALGSRDSQLTVRQRSTLTNRFKLKGKLGNSTAATSLGRTPSPTGSSDDEQHDTNTTSSVIHSPNDKVHWRTPKSSQAVIVAPSQARGDPFNAFPISQSEGVDRLIKFFISRFDVQVSISQVQKQWWGFAIYDPVVLHATLSLAATNWAMLIPDPEVACEEGLKQKGYAIQGVRERITQNDTSDAVIGAVAALASIEAADGDFHAGTTHIKGVQILCQARGGYSAFKENVQVARAMNWADIQVAVGLGSRPLLPLLHTIESISLPPKILFQAAEPSLSHLKIYESSPDNTSIRYSFSVLRQAYYGMKSTVLSVHELRVLINGTDYQLAHVLAQDDITPGGRILLVAAQHFMHHIVRETDNECNIPILLVKRLSKLLKCLQDEWISAPDMWHGLLWCFSIGAAGTPRSQDTWDFYSAKLWEMVQTMSIKHTSEFEAVVRRFAWDDSLSQRLLTDERLRQFFTDPQTTKANRRPKMTTA